MEGLLDFEVACFSLDFTCNKSNVFKRNENFSAVWS